MMIWGLDLATRRTGWCAGTGERRPEAGCWKYPHAGEDLGMLLDLFDRDLNALADRLAPTVVVYEAPLKMQWDKLLSVRKIYSMGAYVELWCRRRGVRCEEVGPVALKILLAGSRKADKATMVRQALRMGITLPEGPGQDDAADSFAAWLSGVQHHAKEFRPRWDRALYGDRGGLL